MVGLFSILSAYFKAPALLMVGPAFYGFSIWYSYSECIWLGGLH